LVKVSIKKHLMALAMAQGIVYLPSKHKRPGVQTPVPQKRTRGGGRQREGEEGGGKKRKERMLAEWPTW
jgi:hypothetical protein